MAPCETYREQLLDHLYGLLDDAEAQTLQDHVAECAGCSRALALAKEQQALLATAAQPLRDVPPFLAPGHQSRASAASANPIAQPAAAECPALLPLSAVPAPKRHPLRRYWPAWAAAAGVLAAALGLNHLYEQGRADRREAVADARKALQTIDAQFAALKKDVALQAEKARAELAADHLHLHAVGPTTYHAAIPAECRVATRDIEGKPLASEVRLEILDARGDVVVHKKAASGGDVALEIPPGLDLKGPGKIVISAKAGAAREVIEETLAPAPTIHATHLAANKGSYFVGDVMFFRALTLDRVSHQPPRESVPLNFALVNEEGKPVMDVAALTGPGGISAGNFALTDDLASGLYTLQVRAADKASHVVLGSALTIEIVRDGLEVEFDRSKYKAGETVNVVARPRNAKAGRAKGGEKAGDKGAAPYGLRILADGKPIPATNAGAFGPDLSQKVTADENGNAVVQFKLPAKLERGEVLVELEKKDEKGVERFVAPVPVVPADIAVDFFPEGGDLVPGVQNRVYYRVRAPGGAAVDADKLTLWSSKGPVHEAIGREGLGCFTFTPDSREAYTVKLKSDLASGGMLEIANPFPRIATGGVAMSVEPPVGKAGDPLEVTLRKKGPERQVLLIASCRGVVFTQHLIRLDKDEISQTIKVPARVDGLLRLTLLDVPDETSEGFSRVTPLAERLIFRAPVEHLEVACKVADNPLRPGSTVKLEIDVRDEKKEACTAWVLAAAVDERVRSPYSEANLPAFFHIATEIASGEDLDQAVVLLNGKEPKDSAVALDLFLSTHGWRRLAPSTEALRLASADAKKTGKHLPVPVFSRENRPLSQQQAAFRDALVERVAGATARANQARVAAGQDREAALATGQAALNELARFEAQPETYLRQALGVGLALLLGAGALALVWSVYRRAQSASPRPALIASMACLACASLLYLGGRTLLTSPSSPDAPRSVAWLHRADWPEFPRPQYTQAMLFGKPAVSPAVGLFALEKADIDAWEAHKDSATARVTRFDGPASVEPPRRDQDATKKPFQGGADRPVDAVRLEPYFQNLELQDRFDAARDAQRRLNFGEDKAKDGKAAGEAREPSILPPPISTGSTAPMGKSKSAGKKDDARVRDEEESLGLLVREYAYKAFPLRPDYQDTVLWHPALLVENGKAQVAFDLSPDVPAYRLLLFVNSPSGRIGFYEGRLEAQTK